MTDNESAERARSSLAQHAAAMRELLESEEARCAQLTDMARESAAIAMRLRRAVTALTDHSPARRTPAAAPKRAATINKGVAEDTLQSIRVLLRNRYGDGRVFVRSEVAANAPWSLATVGNALSVLRDQGFLRVTAQEGKTGRIEYALMPEQLSGVINGAA
jgi:hypothetical protein